MNRWLKGLALAAALWAFAGPASAQTITYTALMDGPSESPPNASPGTGFAQLDYDATLQTLRVQATFSGLIGNTTAAHIHAPTAAPFTGTAGVATQLPSFTGFPLGVTAGAMDTTFDLTLASSWNAASITNNGGTPASAEAAFIAALNGNRAYFNIHSSAFPGGEIRGFLVAVPEPSSMILLGVAGAGVVAYAKRRKASRQR